MKTKLFLLSACANLFVLASCSNGPSAETKEKVATFDSAWATMGNLATATEDSLNACVTMCENGCKAGDAVECCEHMKAAKDSLMIPCKNDMAACGEMKKNLDVQLPMWDSLNTKWTALKDKMAKDEGTDNEINDGIAELQAAMDNGNKWLQEAIGKINEMKMICTKNMDNCKAGWTNVKCMDKKCPMGKKMMEAAKKKGDYSLNIDMPDY